MIILGQFNGISVHIERKEQERTLHDGGIANSILPQSNCSSRTHFAETTLWFNSHQRQAE